MDFSIQHISTFNRWWLDEIFTLITCEMRRENQFSAFFYFFEHHTWIYGMMKVTSETSATSNNVKLIWDCGKSRIRIVNVFSDRASQASNQHTRRKSSEICLTSEKSFLWASYQLSYLHSCSIQQAMLPTADIRCSAFSRIHLTFISSCPIFRTTYAACLWVKQLCRRLHFKLQIIEIEIFVSIVSVAEWTSASFTGQSHNESRCRLSKHFSTRWTLTSFNFHPLQSARRAKKLSHLSASIHFIFEIT